MPTANKLKILGLATAVLALIVLAKKEFRIEQPKQSKLIAYFPFTFSPQVDPTKIFTVGQQVVSEHIFAYAARRSLTRGFTDHTAHVEIDPKEKTVRVALKYDLKKADGSAFDNSNLCDSIKTSVKGTTHSQYGNLLEDVNCNENSVTVRYRVLPVNLRFMFTLPDFSLFDSKNLPIDEVSSKNSTGPYFPTHISDNKIVLKRNQFYPKDLISNEIDTAELISYSADQTEELTGKLKSNDVSAVYFFGNAITKQNLEQLKKNGFNLEISPHEWLTFFKAPLNLRAEISHALNEVVAEIQQESQDTILGTPTNSIIFVDRKPGPPSFSRKPVNAKGLKLLTLKSWSEYPFFKLALKSISRKLQGIEIIEVERSQLMQLYSDQSAISLCMLGLSPVDRLSHLSFLTSYLVGFDRIVSTADIEEASSETDDQIFARDLNNFDRKIRENPLLRPIAFFPGVTATSNEFNVDREKSFDWGIQLWSFQQR